MGEEHRATKSLTTAKGPGARARNSHTVKISVFSRITTVIHELRFSAVLPRVLNSHMLHDFGNSRQIAPSSVTVSCCQLSPLAAFGGTIMICEQIFCTAGSKHPSNFWESKSESAGALTVWKSRALT